jgi:hypothetical protein
MIRTRRISASKPVIKSSRVSSKLTRRLAHGAASLASMMTNGLHAPAGVLERHSDEHC